MAFAGLRQPEQFRDITRAHVIAWREQLVGQELANDTIRRKLAALSSLYAYLCDRNAVLHNPVLGVKRPRSMNREGVTPALSDHQARMLLKAPRPPRSRASGTRPSWRHYSIMAALRGVVYAQSGRHPPAGRGAAIRVEGKGDKVRYLVLA